MTDTSRHERIADQRLIDAILRGRRLDTTASLEARFTRVQEGIEVPQPAGRPRPLARVRRRHSWRTVTRAALGGVSALAAVLMIAVLMQPSPVSATALLEQAQSFELKSSSGVRRYVVSISAPHGRPGMPMLTGILDVRDGEHMRFDLTQPNGTHHIWGMGPEGPWQLPPNGRPKREVKGRWPRWLEGTSQALLIDTMPSLLDLVLDGYDVMTSEEDGMTKLMAIQRDASEGGPDEVVIELDREVGGVFAIELRWAPSSEERWRRARDQARPREGDARPPRRSPQVGDEGRRTPSGVHPARSSGGGERDRARGAHGRRPGGPPAPRVIRFQRVPAEPVDSDWFTGPVNNDSPVSNP